MTVFEQGLPQEKNQAVKHVLGLKPKPPRQHPTGQKAVGSKELEESEEPERPRPQSARAHWLITPVGGAAEVGWRGQLKSACPEPWLAAMMSGHPDGLGDEVPQSRRVPYQTYSSLGWGLWGCGHHFVPQHAIWKLRRTTNMGAHRQMSCGRLRPLRPPECN